MSGLEVALIAMLVVNSSVCGYMLGESMRGGPRDGPREPLKLFDKYVEMNNKCTCSGKICSIKFTNPVFNNPQFGPVINTKDKNKEEIIEMLSGLEEFASIRSNYNLMGKLHDYIMDKQNNNTLQLCFYYCESCNAIYKYSIKATYRFCWIPYYTETLKS